MNNYEPNVSVKAGAQPNVAETPTQQFSDDNLEWSTDLGGENWPTRNVKRRVQLRIPTVVFCVLLFIAAGLWGGASLQKAQGGSTTSGLAGARAAFGRTGGAASLFGSSSTATTGTVTDIIGNTLYVTDSSGNLVKVSLSSSATVTRNATSSLSGLKPGDSVTVQGTKVTNGSMTASSVSATAKGVTPSGGFGGAGGAGGTSKAGG